MRWTAFLPAFVMLFSTNEAFAQPTPNECASLYPCQTRPAKARQHRRNAPAKAAQTDPAILLRLETLEARAGEAPLIQVLPAETAVPSPPVQPVVNNYVTVRNVRPWATRPAKQQSSNVRFQLEVGGLASLHSEWMETSPGFYGAMRLRMKAPAGALVLSLQSGYLRRSYSDGSLVEDIYAEPVVLGYELGRRNLHLTLTCSLGFWSTREDWVTPICGKSSCGGENENGLTASFELVLALRVVQNLEFSMGIPVRLITKTPDGSGWTLGLRAGLGVFLPYP